MKELNGRRIGYARVSTDDQNLDLQRDALTAAGCTTIWEDKASAAARTRKGLDNLLLDLDPGDTLVVWRLDRLARSINQLLKLLERLDEDGIGFLSLQENFETSSATGRLVLHIMAALSEFERGLISERTKAGMRAAKKRGQKVGPDAKMTPQMVEDAQGMRDNGRTAKHIAEYFGKHYKLKISQKTIYNYTVQKGSKKKPARKLATD
jgi:DNA invertase Pin-like site-specific DNA recombinase